MQQTIDKPKSKWKLAGHEVTQTMFYDAEKAKRNGRKVYFVTAGESDLTGHSDEDCVNCGGFGYLALEMVVSGPFKNSPNGKQGKDGETASIHLSPAWHNGAWWQVARSMYLCPVCSVMREIVL